MEPVVLSATHVVLLLPGEIKAWSYMLSSRHARPTFRGVLRSTAIVGVAAIGISTGGLATSVGAVENPTVSLTVNGTTTTVTTTAPTVAALLTERHVRYDDNDLLTPSAPTAITDGLDVTLQTAIAISLVDRGVRENRIVTARTAAGVRHELDLPSANSAQSRQKKSLSYQRTRIYGPNGSLRTGSEPVFEDSVVMVEGVRVAFPEGNYRIKNAIKKNRTPLMRSGTTRVTQRGHDGRKHIVWSKTFVDQELVAKRIEESTVLRQAQKRVVTIGTGPNWRGLAQCESGGNPNAVSPAGYYGLYQFSLSTWHAVGGHGNPVDANYWEQTKRAWILYKGSGRSPWPVCGRFL